MCSRQVAADVRQIGAKRRGIHLSFSHGHKTGSNQSYTQLASKAIAKAMQNNAGDRSTVLSTARLIAQARDKSYTSPGVSGLFLGRCTRHVLSSQAASETKLAWNATSNQGVRVCQSVINHTSASKLCVAQLQGNQLFVIASKWGRGGLTRGPAATSLGSTNIDSAVLRPPILSLSLDSP